MQHEPLQGKVDPRRLRPDKSKDDRQQPNYLKSAGADGKPSARVARRGGTVCPLGDREFAGGGEGNCPLWYGHIIDATFPLV